MKLYTNKIVNIFSVIDQIFVSIPRHYYSVRIYFFDRDCYIYLCVVDRTTRCVKMFFFYGDNAVILYSINNKLYTNQRTCKMDLLILKVGRSLTERKMPKNYLKTGKIWKRKSVEKMYLKGKISKGIMSLVNAHSTFLRTTFSRYFIICTSSNGDE